jgi:hypothetical protein
MQVTCAQGCGGSNNKDTVDAFKFMIFLLAGLALARHVTLYSSRELKYSATGFIHTLATSPSGQSTLGSLYGTQTAALLATNYSRRPVLGPPFQTPAETLANLVGPLARPHTCCKAGVCFCYDPCLCCAHNHDHVMAQGTAAAALCSPAQHCIVQHR